MYRNTTSSDKHYRATPWTRECTLLVGFSRYANRRLVVKIRNPPALRTDQGASPYVCTEEILLLILCKGPIPWYTTQSDHDRSTLLVEERLLTDQDES